MKKILMTNAYIKDFTGSEIDTITIANYLSQKGFFVDVFTLEKGYPLLSKVNDDIRVLDYSENDKLLNCYDYIWAHHYPLLDFILFDKKIKATYIHYIGLSSIAEFEAFPQYYEDLSLISILSQEARNIVVHEGYNTEKFNIFPNYVLNTEVKEKHVVNPIIKKICIVSNHVPSELENSKELFEKKGISVDIFGKNHVYKLITPGLLNKYDIVISIGKTINLAIALGIPSYVYDHFGGDGYIVPNNIQESFDFHFTGKCKRYKLSSKELVEEIITNYAECLKGINVCMNFAEDNFILEKLIDNTFKLLDKKPMNYEEFYKKYNTLFRKGPLFVRENGRRQIEINNQKLFLQVYYDPNSLYNEESSIKVNIEDNIVTYKSKYFSQETNFRIDLLNKAGYVITDLMLNGHKLESLESFGLCICDDIIFTVHNDPWIELKNVHEFTISYKVEKIDEKIISEYYRNGYEKILNLSQYPIYVKGFLKPKLIVEVEGKVLSGILYAKNENNVLLKTMYDYNIDNNCTYIVFPVKGKKMTIYSNFEGISNTLILEYEYSLLKKVIKKIRHVFS